MILKLKIIVVTEVREVARGERIGAGELERWILAAIMIIGCVFYIIFDKCPISK